MKSIYNQTLNENFDAETNIGGTLDDLLTWDVTNALYFTDLTPALKAIEQKMQEYKAKFKGATLVALQSDLTPSKL